MKLKPNGKDSKTERLSVHAWIIDLPPSYSEGISDGKEGHIVARRNHKSEFIVISVSDTELKRRVKKEGSALRLQRVRL